MAKKPLVKKKKKPTKKKLSTVSLTCSVHSKGLIAHIEANTTSNYINCNGLDQLDEFIEQLCAARNVIASEAIKFEDAVLAITFKTGDGKVEGLNVEIEEF